VTEFEAMIALPTQMRWLASRWDATGNVANKPVASLRSATGGALKSLRPEQQGRRRRDEPGRFQFLIPQLNRNSNITNNLSRASGCWCAILRRLIPSLSRCFQSLKNQF